jgi:hypothetical protein
MTSDEIIAQALAIEVVRSTLAVSLHPAQCLFVPRLGPVIPNNLLSENRAAELQSHRNLILGVD